MKSNTRLMFGFALLAIGLLITGGVLHDIQSEQGDVRYAARGTPSPFSSWRPRTYEILRVPDYLLGYLGARAKTYQDVHDALVALQWTKDFTGRGIVKLGNSKEIIELVEKPDETQALRFKQRCGYLAIAGIFILKTKMFKYIEDTTPGVNNETWLTDSLKLALIDSMNVCGYICKNRVIDIGSYDSLKQSREIR